MTNKEKVLCFVTTCITLAILRKSREKRQHKRMMDSLRNSVKLGYVCQ